MKGFINFPQWIKDNSLATLVRVFVLAAFLVTAIQTSAFAGAQDFVLVNNSGQVIKRLYLSPSGSGDWESNILNQPIYHGQSRTIRVNGYSRAYDYWDIRVSTSNGTVWEWYGINLLSVGRITVDGAGTAHY